jgi:hypothetical protein
MLLSRHAIIHQSYNHPLASYFPACGVAAGTGGTGLFKNLGGTPLAA